MGLIALFFLPFRFLSVFGFTFTDIEDYMPLLTLFVGLISVYKISRLSGKEISPYLFSSLLLLSLWPVLPTFGLFLLAREFQSVYGSWPQVFVDTPWDMLGNVSLKYDILLSLVGYLEAFSGAWMIIFLALLFTVQSRLSQRQSWACISFVAVSLLLILFDPGNLYQWWMD